MASPIEDQLFNALCAAANHRRMLDGRVAELWFWRTEADWIAFLYRDQPALTYRIDLLLVPWQPKPRQLVALAIECDGHDFHDRTKQQAAYDRSRDRELLLRGVTTIRFTGSEIFHSAERCATEAVAVFSALMDRALETERAAAWCG